MQNWAYWAFGKIKHWGGGGGVRPLCKTITCNTEKQGNLIRKDMEKEKETYQFKDTKKKRTHENSINLPKASVSKRQEGRRGDAR